jgi:uncharacterized protein
MSRPPKTRKVCPGHAAAYFKPQGVPLHLLEEVVLGLDAIEALRLVDLEGLQQDAAGARMGVSRGTVGRLLERAHRVIADALVTGKALRLEGGPVAMQLAEGICPACSRRKACAFALRAARIESVKSKAETAKE